MLGGLGFELEFILFREIAVAAVAILTILSLIVYLNAWLRHMTEYDDDGEGAS